MKTIKLIGVGGIGTNLLSFLPRYLANQRKDLFEFTLVDGDKFEQKNAERQVFAEQGNKAEVKARELRAQFPHLTVLAVPEFVTRKNVRDVIQGGDIVLLAVDNDATRRLVSKRCQQLWNVVLISGGNDLEDYSVYTFVRRDRKNLKNPMERYHSEIQFPQDQNPGENPDCLELAAGGEPQLGLTNMAAALGMARALYQILEGEDPAEEVHHGIRDDQFQAIRRMV